MFRLILGFILGVVATYYTITALQPSFDGINKSKIKQLFQSDELTHSSNTFNSMPPPESFKLNNQNNISTQIQTAITLISAHDLNKPTSDYVITIITELIEHEPKLQQYVRIQLKNGLTNKEALNIFEKYFSLQG